MAPSSATLGGRGTPSRLRQPEPDFARVIRTARRMAAARAAVGADGHTVECVAPRPGPSSPSGTGSPCPSAQAVRTIVSTRISQIEVEVFSCVFGYNPT